MSLALLALYVEVVHGEVLPPLLAPCVSNFFNFFTLDGDVRPVVAPDGELLHPEEVVAPFLNRILYCQSLKFDNGVRFLSGLRLRDPHVTSLILC
jgi:hypothetical protein